MKLKVIAYARNGHTDKFGIPRQSREESPILTRIVFEPEYSVAEALRGIEGFSHLWLIWGFSENTTTTGKNQHGTGTKPVQDSDEASETWSPTVRPPRLGGNKRMGVFATRSPFRPNPVGLSSVKLVGVVKSRKSNVESSSLELIVSGADLLDGTPIYDIKPYLSFSDCHEEAKNGFADDAKDYRLEVVGLPSPPNCLRDESVPIPSSVLKDIAYILSQDPRPAYQDDPNREYKLDYSGYTVTFVVQDRQAIVKNIEKM